MCSSPKTVRLTLLASLLVLSAGAAYAQDAEPAAAQQTAAAQKLAKQKLHITDSSTDRTPAKTAFPSYPKIARRDRIEGDAMVCFKIDLQGRIRSVKVRNYTHRIFRRPALRAAKDSSFEPLQPHEVFSASRTCRTYRFRLEPLVVDNKTTDQ